MVPTAESFRRTGDRGLFGRRAGASFTFFSLIATATLTTSTLAFASGFALEDDSALIVGSDSVIYSLNLSTGVAAAGATLTGDAPAAGFRALEADPTSDTAFVGSQMDGSYTEVDTSTGSATFIVTTYGMGASVDGIVRMPDGSAYVAYVSPTSFQSEIASLDLVTGIISNEQEVTLAGGNERLLALAHSGDSIYGFLAGDSDALYSVNPATGVMTLERAASGVVTSGDIVAADSTADGVLYLLAYNAGAKVSTLYSLDPASGGTTTSIAQITGLAAGKTAENLAIATLLDSERPADSEPSPSNDSDSDRDEEEVVEASPAPPPPVYKPPTKTLPEVEAEPDESPTVSEPGPEIVDVPDTEPTPDVRTQAVAEEANGLDGTTLALVALSALALVLLTVVLIAVRARSARR